MYNEKKKRKRRRREEWMDEKWGCEAASTVEELHVGSGRMARRRRRSERCV